MKRALALLSLLLAFQGLPPAGRAQQTVQTQEPLIANETKPKHPTLPDTAARRSLTGVIHKVTCGYPARIEFQLVGVKRSVWLYNNNFAKIDLSVLGFDPTGPMDPCHQFEGMKASVEYIPGKEKSFAGQVASVVLRK